jgi:murein DD-endopeptidase MepM/ murein hydrolase activator NlpD
VTTVAGDGVPGYIDGPAHQARFNGPIGIAISPDGLILVSDSYNDRIRVIDAEGNVTTLAGSGRPGADDGVGDSASLDTPTGIAIDARGIIYVADTGNGIVRTVDLDGRVTTPGWAHGDGFSRPLGVAVGTDGELYVADEGGRIVAIRHDGGIRTLAGAGLGFRDGAGAIAQFRSPSGVAALRPGHLVVADAGNALVRMVVATSQLGLQLPTSPTIRPQFDAEAFRSMPLLWPVAPFSDPHEVAGSFGEVRGGSGERFHRGIDVRVEQGTRVYAVRDGIVSSPVSNNGFGALDEWLRIGDAAYVHIRAGRTRRNALLDSSRFVATYDGRRLKRLRVKRGARFATGDLIGTVNRFNHVHLNIGWPSEEHNPLLFRLVRFEDTVAPSIPPDGIRVYDESWRQQTTYVQNRLILNGRVRVVIDAWDQSDDNTPSRRLAPYELGYHVLKMDGSPAAGFQRRASLRFDQVGPDPNASQQVYGAGSGIPFYGGRRTRYFYIVTNRLDRGQTAEGFWETSRMPPGDYILRGWAADVAGNKVERDLLVSLGAADEEKR